jgi:hypothetical protein
VSTRELQGDLTQKMSTFLGEYGFALRKKHRTWFAPRPFGSVLFHLTYARNKDVSFDVLADVAVRVDAVEETMARVELEKNQLRGGKNTATIGRMLTDPATRHPCQWTVAVGGDIAPVAALVAQEFKRSALPYFERFWSLEQILSVLTCHDEQGRSHMPFHDLRCQKAVLLAKVMNNDNEQIRHIVDDCRRFLPTVDRSAHANFEVFLRVIGMT